MATDEAAVRERALVSALRLADEGTVNDTAFAAVARVLLSGFPETDPDDTAGAALLLEAIRDGRLRVHARPAEASG